MFLTISNRLVTKFSALFAAAVPAAPAGAVPSGPEPPARPIRPRLTDRFGGLPLGGSGLGQGLTPHKSQHRHSAHKSQHRQTGLNLEATRSYLGFQANLGKKFSKIMNKFA